jgi:hypothetical protein
LRKEGGGVKEHTTTVNKAKRVEEVTRQQLMLTVTYLELGIGPSRNLDNHVQDSLLLVGVERNIMERRNGLAILLDVDSVLEGVGSRNLADGVVGGHVGLLL